MTRLDIGGDGGLFGVDGLIVAKNGGGGDGGVGEITLVQTQLIKTAEHTVGLDAPELALFNLHAAGEGGLVLGNGNQIAHMDVPCAGDDLNSLIGANVDLADPHMVGVGVTLQSSDLTHHHVGDLSSQILKTLHLGAGEGHSLRKIFIVCVNGDKLVEPFSA